MRRARRGGRSRWELGGRLNPAAGCSIDTRRHYRLYYTTIFYSVLFYSPTCWAVSHGALPTSGHKGEHCPSPASHLLSFPGSRDRQGSGLLAEAETFEILPGNRLDYRLRVQ